MARKKTWVYSPPKAPKPKVTESVKSDLKQKADNLIETVIKPEHIKEPPKEVDLNYIVDIYSKWYRNYFYFCAKYNCPSPNAISPSFESKFARMEYLENGKFNLSYMRHTEQWWEIYSDLAMDKCLKYIGEGGHFMP